MILVSSTCSVFCKWSRVLHNMINRLFIIHFFIGQMDNKQVVRFINSKIFIYTCYRFSPVFKTILNSGNDEYFGKIFAKMHKIYARVKSKTNGFPRNVLYYYRLVISSIESFLNTTGLRNSGIETIGKLSIR